MDQRQVHLKGEVRDEVRGEPHGGKPVAEVVGCVSSCTDMAETSV
jgi:hypothetical protein